MNTLIYLAIGNFIQVSSNVYVDIEIWIYFGDGDA